jgi:hypothetical protein
MIIRLDFTTLFLPLAICLALGLLTRQAADAHAAVSESGDVADGPWRETAAENAPAMEIRLEASGVGGIDAHTPATAEALASALGGLRIDEVQASTEGTTYPTFRAHRDGETLITIVPGPGQTIYAVIIASPEIVNGLGPGVGTRFRDAYAPDRYEDCVPGSEELSGAVLCPAPAASNVVYLFTGQWDGPDGETPPLDRVLDWTLGKISWRPPTPD